MEKYEFSPEELAFYENSGVPLIVYQYADKRIRTLAVSKQIVTTFKLKDLAEAYEIMEHDMYRYTHPDDIAGVANAALAFATEGGSFNILYRSLIGGEYHVIHAMGSHVYPTENIKYSVVWYLDEGPYTEGEMPSVDEVRQSYGQKLRENFVARSLHFDNLTGLPGMTYFFQLADIGCRMLQEQGYQPAIVYFNLSGIKYFNKKYGFSQGDQLIRSLSTILVNHFGLDNCSRLSQDHFAVYTKLEGLEEVLREIFDEALQINGGNTLPIKAGIYVEPPELTETSLACDRAKYACSTIQGAYESDFVYFNDNMQISEEKRHHILDHLDQAIEENWIQPFFQPIIRAANGCVCDEEALARWIEPGKGMLSPAEFIPVLEESMQIYKMDLHILDGILKKMKRQAEEGLFVVPTSLNLSRTDFDMCDMVEEICRRVDEAGVERSKITIEITESVVGSDIDFIKDQVEAFQAEGFQVWMDDFGSGYSSLDVLQTIRFDVLKLDMRFMKQFDQGEKSKIILTELVRMALSLGIDTVCEGVETAEQVAFLQEIGCTKLQGFHFCKPISFDTLLERYRTGTQIGFENPAESDYFSAIGRINLYDISVLCSDDADSLQDYFDTLPMAILETDGKIISVNRCNEAYRCFLAKNLMVDISKAGNFNEMPLETNTTFLRAIRQCAADGKKIFFDEMVAGGDMVHSMLRRIAKNPITGMSCLAVVVLAMQKNAEQNVTFAHIANALSSDYLSLYYVNTDTEHFIEYTPNSKEASLSVVREGNNFFSESQKDALKYIFKDDRDEFVKAFNRESVLQAIEEHDTFTCSYRLLINETPTYVNMKAARMSTSSHHIIVGVNNVDAQMQQQEAYERIKDEQSTYNRLMALSGDYVCIYAVDLKTDHYIEYDATDSYTELGLAKQGDDFFAVSHRNCRLVVHPEDQEMFITQIDKENILRILDATGSFSINYRMIIDDTYKYINLKGALVNEKDSPQLILGVVNIDQQVRREQEFDQQLMIAKSMANMDTLTGLKNKSAYDSLAEELDQKIREGIAEPFAVVLFDVNGLRKVNESRGNQAGDRQLKRAKSIICELFDHSPVFRIGGDEFAVIARGKDYEIADQLVEDLKDANLKRKEAGDIVIACGMARHQGEKTVAEVFRRADAKMYFNKRDLKH